jgi:hypothetical protein
LLYAFKIALKALFGYGHYSSVYSHLARLRRFVRFLQDELGVRDIAKNNPQALLEAYARYVGRHFNQDDIDEFDLPEMSAAYGQNLITSAQVGLRAMTGRSDIFVSPVRYTRRRSNVRRIAPESLDLGSYDTAIEQLEANGLFRISAICGLMRHFGMRCREATLANLPRLLLEAEKYGMINVQDGTKGGRTAARWVPVSEMGLAALQAAADCSPEGSRNLLDPAETWIGFRNGELNAGRALLKSAGIPKYHDLRAAYACERYLEVACFAAPCVSGERPKDRLADRRARQVIAYELGHARIDVTVSYAGGRR